MLSSWAKNFLNVCVCPSNILVEKYTFLWDACEKVYPPGNSGEVNPRVPFFPLSDASFSFQIRARWLKNLQAHITVTCYV